MNSISPRRILPGLVIDFVGVVLIAGTVLFATSIDWDFERTVAIGPLNIPSWAAIALGFVIGAILVTTGMRLVLRELREANSQP